MQVYTLGEADGALQRLIVRNIETLRSVIYQVDIPQLVENTPKGQFPLEVLTAGILGTEEDLENCLRRFPSLRHLEIRQENDYSSTENAIVEITDVIAACCPQIEVVKFSSRSYVASPRIRALSAMKSLRLLQCCIFEAYRGISSLEETKNLIETISRTVDSPTLALTGSFFATPQVHGLEPILSNLVRLGDLESVEHVLKLGANPNQVDKESEREPPLWIACINDDLEMFKLLLRHGADPLVVEGPELASCFSIAVAVSAEKCLDHLLSDYLTQPDVVRDLENTDRSLLFRNGFGESLLHLAVVERTEESDPDKTERVAELVLRNLNFLRLSVDDRDYQLRSPMHQPIASRRISDMLLQQGANLNALDSDGKAPIFHQTRSLVAHMLEKETLHLDTYMLGQWVVIGGCNLASHILVAAGLELFKSRAVPIIPLYSVYRVLPDFICDLFGFLFSQAKDYERWFGPGSTLLAAKFLLSTYSKEVNITSRISRQELTEEGRKPYNGRRSKYFTLGVLQDATPLHLAILNDVDMDVIEFLIDKGALLNLPCGFANQNETSVTPLALYAMRQNALDMIAHMKLLVKHGARIHPHFSLSRHPIKVAVEEMLVAADRGAPTTIDRPSRRRLTYCISALRMPLVLEVAEVILSSYESPLSDFDQQSEPKFQTHLPEPVFTGVLQWALRILEQIRGRGEDMRTQFSSLETFTCQLSRLIMNHYKKTEHKFTLPIARTVQVITAGSANILQLFAIEFQAAMVAEACLDALVSGSLDSNSAVALLQVLVRALRPFKAAVEKSMRPALRRAFIRASSWEDTTFLEELRKVYTVDEADEKDLGRVNCAIS